MYNLGVDQMMSYQVYRQQTASNDHFNNMQQLYSAGYPPQAVSMNHVAYRQNGDAYMQQNDQMWRHQQGHHNGVVLSPQHYSNYAQYVPAGVPQMQHYGESSQGSGSVHSPAGSLSSCSEMGHSPNGQIRNMSPPQLQQIHHKSGIKSYAASNKSPYGWMKASKYHNSPNPGKTRTKDKYRVVYSDHQRMELEREFTFVNKYITINRKNELSDRLGLSHRQVKIWFQNRRAKERRQHKKSLEEKSQIEMLSQNMQATLMVQQPIHSPNAGYANMQQVAVPGSSHSPNGM